MYCLDVVRDLCVCLCESDYRQYYSSRASLLRAVDVMCRRYIVMRRGVVIESEDSSD